MRYYTVLLNDEEKVAVSTNGKDLYLLESYKDMDALIAAGGVHAIPKDAKKVNAGMVKLLSPIPRPRQDVLCLGINYTAHAEEAERFFQRKLRRGTSVSYFLFQTGLLFPGNGCAHSRVYRPGGFP